jgi:hypothetical protein
MTPSLIERADDSHCAWVARRPDGTDRMHKVAFVLASCTWIGLALTAAAPAKLRSRWAWGFGQAAIFFVAAAATRFAFQETPSRLQVVAFSLVAAFFATRRLGAADRSSWNVWLTCTGAAFAGVVLVKWLLEGTVL